MEYKEEMSERKRRNVYLLSLETSLFLSLNYAIRRLRR